MFQQPGDSRPPGLPGDPAQPPMSFGRGFVPNVVSTPVGRGRGRGICNGEPISFHLPPHSLPPQPMIVRPPIGRGIPSSMVPLPPPGQPNMIQQPQMFPQMMHQPLPPPTAPPGIVQAMDQMHQNQLYENHSVMMAGEVSSSSEQSLRPEATVSTTNVMKRPAHLRKAGGEVWSDTTLDEWGSDDYRIFCGDLGNEVTDELLANAFRHIKSFSKARVIRDRRTGKGKGYGFVSFTDPKDMLKAMTDMNRKYVGNRPIRVMKSKWREREIDSERNKTATDTVVATPVNSKTLKKFKIMKPVTGGKKSKAIPPALAASGTRRGFHGPRPPPFVQIPRIARQGDAE